MRILTHAGWPGKHNCPPRLIHINKTVKTTCKAPVTGDATTRCARPRSNSAIPIIKNHGNYRIYLTPRATPPSSRTPKPRAETRAVLFPNHTPPNPGTRFTPHRNPKSQPPGPDAAKCAPARAGSTWLDPHRWRSILLCSGSRRVDIPCKWRSTPRAGVGEEKATRTSLAWQAGWVSDKPDAAPEGR